ncbi:hypothetical protein CBR_g21215 [Chara braunii]|uniref:Uncharacterized protein n=1 Tax=Chara braunii TaxID=69332 RepID=A0A388L187_CHABU|nr:hypothetical protein CBR_g21215 [Chara braunii]|eukprot:GBG75973.1 hypothetical protein CBR_g21215 [Chara braunii]
MEMTAEADRNGVRPARRSRIDYAPISFNQCPNSTSSNRDDDEVGTCLEVSDDDEVGTCLEVSDDDEVGTCVEVSDDDEVGTRVEVSDDDEVGTCVEVSDDDEVGVDEYGRTGFDVTRAQTLTAQDKRRETGIASSIATKVQSERTSSIISKAANGGYQCALANLTSCRPHQRPMAKSS